MEISLTYEEALAKYPDEVGWLLKGLQRSKCRWREADPSTLKWAIYASAVCDDSYGYQFHDDLNAITIPRAFRACIRLSAPKFRETHQVGKAFYSLNLTRGEFPKEILAFYSEQHKESRKHWQESVPGRKPMKTLRFAEARMIQCTCGRWIIGSNKLSEEDFVKTHNLGVFMNTRTGVTFTYLCCACNSRVRDHLQKVKEIFGTEAPHIYLNNLLR